MSAALPICLVVDDSRVVRKVARRILEAHGYEIVEAENGQIALELCQRALPRCILLDWNMPVMNGPGVPQGFARRVRAGWTDRHFLHDPERGRGRWTPHSRTARRNTS